MFIIEFFRDPSDIRPRVYKCLDGLVTDGTCKRSRGVGREVHHCAFIIRDAHKLVLVPKRILLLWIRGLLITIVPQLFRNDKDTP